MLDDDKIFAMFASIVYFLLHIIYAAYKGRINERFIIINAKNIFFMYVYNNYTYLQFTIMSFLYEILSWYVFIVHGMRI